MNETRGPHEGKVPGEGGTTPARESDMARLVSSKKQGDVGIVRLGGPLTRDSALGSLEEWVEEHFVDDGITTIRIDLSEVTKIDLEGVAALGLLLAESIKQGKNLRAEGASVHVQRKLEETGLDRYLGGSDPPD